jgi:hypothetical protein
MAEEFGISPGTIAGRFKFLTGKRNLFKGLFQPLQCAVGTGTGSNREWKRARFDK